MRRLTLRREALAELTGDELERVVGGITNPSCVNVLCALQDETVLRPCYESSHCSHPC